MIIFKENIAIHNKQRKVYYRPAIGECDCKLQYDGQEHLLFNLDNTRLFYYGLLFQYLNLMLEGRNPLIAYQRFVIIMHVTEFQVVVAPLCLCDIVRSYICRITLN